MIIGIIGKLKSGKTTISRFIQEKYPDVTTTKLAFGDDLKEMIYNASLCTRDELWGEKTKFSRFIMQKIGTEIIRKQVDENFWVNKMLTKVVETRRKNGKDSLIIIDDIRFKNEAEFVSAFDDSILIRINRPELEQNKEENLHLSETEQDNIEVNYTIINDGSLDELRRKVDNLFNNIVHVGE